MGPVATGAGPVDAGIGGGGNPCKPALAAAAVTPAKIPATVEPGVNLALADSSLFSSSLLFKQALLGFMLRSVVGETGHTHRQVCTTRMEEGWRKDGERGRKGMVKKGK